MLLVRSSEHPCHMLKTWWRIVVESMQQHLSFISLPTHTEITDLESAVFCTTFPSCKCRFSSYIRSMFFKLTRYFFLYIFYFSDSQFKSLFLSSLKHWTAISGIHKLKTETLKATKGECKKSLWVFLKYCCKYFMCRICNAFCFAFFHIFVFRLEVQGDFKRVLEAHFSIFDLVWNV